MKTIVITGAAGFIGSHFVEDICADPKNSDTRFVLVDCLTYAADYPAIEKYINSGENIFFEKVDVRDQKALHDVFQRFEPNGVIHFAAESHVDRSIDSPNEFIETNVVGTLNLLNLSLQRFQQGKLDRYYQISTDEVYGDLHDEDPAFTEDSPLKANSPYSASKASADLLVRAFHKTYNLPTLISRCSNNYGPNQNQEKFIPVIVRSILQKKKIPVYGTGRNIRDWIFVKDHVAAVWELYQKGQSGEIYNIGGECEIRNLDLVKMLLELLKADPSLIEMVTDRKGHDWRYAIDCNKVKNQLGWSPKTRLDEGLQVTIQHYREKFAP